MNKIITITLILLALSLSACFEPAPVYPGNDNNNPTSEEYKIEFRYTEGTAYFKSTSVALESNETDAGTQKLETISIARTVTDEAATLDLYTTSFSFDGNTEKDMCEEAPTKAKKRTVTIYPNGLADFGSYQQTLFHLPEEKVQIGDEWKIEEMDYKIEELAEFENIAGKFNCLKISFSGVVTGENGTAWRRGYFLYDPEQKLNIKESVTEETSAFTARSENEITKIIPDFDEEIDLSCIFPTKGKSLEETFIAAVNYFQSGEYEGAAYLSEKTKDLLSQITDLNSEQQNIKKNTLALIALSYERLNEPGKELYARLEAAEYFTQFIEETNVDTYDFEQVYENYKRVSESHTPEAAAAKEKFDALNEKIPASLNGIAKLSDTGETDGLLIELTTGNQSITHELREVNEEYSIPLYKFEEGQKFAALYHKPFYKPRALTGLEVNSENLAVDSYTVILSRVQDTNNGWLAGFCYRLNEDGSIKEMLDSTVTVTKIGTNTEPMETECKDGFYSIEVPIGEYAIDAMSVPFIVKTGRTTIAHTARS